MAKLVVKSSTSKDIVDITRKISEQIKSVETGAALVNVLHTTAALTTADLDPGTDLDFLDFLDSLVPGIKWRHPHDPGHAPSHLLSSLIGSSLVVPVENGRLVLGTWQRIILVELDGPRERNVAVSMLP